MAYEKARQCGANTDGQAATGEDKTGATGMGLVKCDDQSCCRARAHDLLR